MSSEQETILVVCAIICAIFGAIAFGAMLGMFHAQLKSKILEDMLATRTKQVAELRQAQAAKEAQ